MTDTLRDKLINKGWVTSFNADTLVRLIEQHYAALADEPAVPEGREPASVVREPSDEELLALVPQGSESDFYLPQGLPSNWVDGDFIAPPEAVVAFARAVLARFGHHSPEATKMVSDAYQMGRRDASADSQQAAEAAEDEVVDEVRYVVYELRDQANDLSPSSELFGLIHNAADLLERQCVPVPVPVPVSERLPEAGDCDAEGRCWVWWKNGVRWVLDEWTHHELREGRLSDCVSHWLPAYALPLPELNREQLRHQNSAPSAIPEPRRFFNRRALSSPSF